MPVVLIETPADRPAPRLLTEDDAVNIWIARWMRVRQKDLIRRYGCDPRRLYEIWEGARFPASREKALETVRVRYPSVLDRIDLGPHRRVSSRSAHPDQLSLFE